MLKTSKLKKFIDFDKNRNIVYDNLWLDDHKITIKISLSEENLSKDMPKIEEFNLSKYSFLLSYE
ncbi:MAG: hypothetical protein EU539_07655 [Promethearchaeota archaeon]|nr:MAG: hypothetical protein EU539_07655 [Candidatus Lokiarchaeota archaeon]